MEELSVDQEQNEHQKSTSKFKSFGECQTHFVPSPVSLGTSALAALQHHLPRKAGGQWVQGGAERNREGSTSHLVLFHSRIIEPS